MNYSIGPSEFAKESGRYEAVTFIQTNIKNHYDRGMIARSEDKLDFFWRDFGSEFKWNGPKTLTRGITGTPSLIESTLGNKGNFELVVPFINGNLAYFYCGIDDDFLSWHGPWEFGMNAGIAQSVSLIQSNFGEPGHLELVAKFDDQLGLFWRDSGQDFRWRGPQYLSS